MTLVEFFICWCDSMWFYVNCVQSDWTQDKLSTDWLELCIYRVTCMTLAQLSSGYGWPELSTEWLNFPVICTLAELYTGWLDSCCWLLLNCQHHADLVGSAW